MKRLHLLAALIKDDMTGTESRQNLLLINPHTIVQLGIHTLLDLMNQAAGFLNRHAVTFPARSHSLVLGHTYFIELFQIR